MSKYELELLNAVSLRGSVSVTELAALLQVSDQTVRRIVKPLVERGEVRKVHGAIVDARRITDPPFLSRMTQNREAKVRIAAAVAKRIQNGDTLALDTGSTTGFIAQALSQHRDLTVVTNSSFIASTLSMVAGNRVFMAGSQLRNHDGAAFDRQAFEVIASFHVRWAILSASAVTAKQGFMVQEKCEADLSALMMENSEKRIMAVDSTKFGKSGLIALPALADGDLLVSDQAPAGDFTDLVKPLELVAGWAGPT